MDDQPASEGEDDEPIAFDEGLVAGEKGFFAKDNPYHEGTLTYEDWHRGWTVGNGNR